MSHNGKNRLKLIGLWQDNCHCHFCGQPTVLVITPPEASRYQHFRHAPHFATRATLDHLRSKLNSLRQQPCDGKKRIVLACYKCNQRRCREEQAALPIEELHRRSGRFPRKTDRNKH